MAREAAGLKVAVAEDARAIAEIFLASRRAAMPYLPSLYGDAEVLRWIEEVVPPESRVLLAALGGDRTAGFGAVRAGNLDHLYVYAAKESRRSADADRRRWERFRRNVLALAA